MISGRNSLHHGVGDAGGKPIPLKWLPDMDAGLVQQRIVVERAKCLLHLKQYTIFIVGRRLVQPPATIREDLKVGATLGHLELYPPTDDVGHV